MSRAVVAAEVPLSRRQKTETFAEARIPRTLEIRVLLRTPDGVEMDLSERIEDPGTLRNVVEVELLEFALPGSGAPRFSDVPH